MVLCTYNEHGQETHIIRTSVPARLRWYASTGEHVRPKPASELRAKGEDRCVFGGEVEAIPEPLAAGTANLRRRIHSSKATYV